MLEIRPFTPADLDVVTALARDQDFDTVIGYIEIYPTPIARGSGSPGKTTHRWAASRRSPTTLTTPSLACSW